VEDTVNRSLPRRSVDTIPSQSQANSTGARVPAPASPLLAHIHIPKTGGESVYHLLQHFDKGHVNLYVDNPLFVYSEPALTPTVCDSAVRSVSSHFVLTFPPYLAGRRMLYLTLLREPVQQFLSYLTFIRKIFRNLRDENHLARLPADPPALTSREFAFGSSRRIETTCHFAKTIP
jgi:hypothetical protein